MGVKSLVFLFEKPFMHLLFALALADPNQVKVVFLPSSHGPASTGQLHVLGHPQDERIHMNANTYTRPADPHADRIARKLKKRGIDPAKAAKKDDALSAIQALPDEAKKAMTLTVTAKPEDIRTPEERKLQELELARMLHAEHPDEFPDPDAKPTPEDAPVAITEEPEVVVPVSEPITEEQSPAQELAPVIEAPAEAPIAPAVEPETKKIATAAIDYTPAPKPKQFVASGILTHRDMGIGVVIDGSFAELLRKRGKYYADHVSLEVNDRATKKPVTFIFQGPILGNWQNLEGKWGHLQGLPSRGDGLRRYTIEVKPKGLPITGILRAYRWPALDKVAFEFDLAKNGTYHVNVTQLNAGLTVHVGRAEYKSGERTLVRTSVPQDEEQVAAPQAAKPVEPTPAPQAQRSNERQQQTNHGEHDKKVAPPKGFKAKGQRKQAQKPMPEERNKRKMTALLDKLLKVFPDLMPKVEVPDELFLLSPAYVPTAPASETFRLLARAEEVKEALLAESKKITDEGVSIIMAIQTIMEEVARDADETCKMISEVEGHCYINVQLDPTTQHSAALAARAKMMAKLKEQLFGSRFSQNDGRSPNSNPFTFAGGFDPHGEEEEQSGLH